MSIKKAMGRGFQKLIHTTRDGLFRLIYGFDVDQSSPSKQQKQTPSQRHHSQAKQAPDRDNDGFRRQTLNQARSKKEKTLHYER